MELLRAPARAHPTSLAGQLRYVRERWAALLGEDLAALLIGCSSRSDVIAEEERGLHLRFGGGGGMGGGGGHGRGAGPDRPGRRAGAVLQRLGVDAAPGADGEEHVRLAGPAVAHVRARRSGRSTRSPTRSWTGCALRLHRAVADRPVGAQPRVAAHQAAARQPRRGRPRPTRSMDYRIAEDLGGEAPGRTCATAPGRAASGSRATWCPTTWASTRAG